MQANHPPITPPCFGPLFFLVPYCMSSYMLIAHKSMPELESQTKDRAGAESCTGVKRQQISEVGSPTTAPKAKIRHRA